MELPQLVDPIECLQQQRVFEGTVDSTKLPRLSEVLSEPNHAIPYLLTFSRDTHGRYLVTCSIATTLQVVCQRCAGPLDLAVEVDSTLCVIADDKLAEKLPQSYEPLVTTDAGMFSPLEVIEEELLLAIPMIPRHDETDCPVNLSNELLN